MLDGRAALGVALVGLRRRALPEPHLGPVHLEGQRRLPVGQLGLLGLGGLADQALDGEAQQLARRSRRRAAPPRSRAGTARRGARTPARRPASPCDRRGEAGIRAPGRGRTPPPRRDRRPGPRACQHRSHERDPGGARPTARARRGAGADRGVAGPRRQRRGAPRRLRRLRAGRHARRPAARAGDQGQAGLRGGAGRGADRAERRPDRAAGRPPGCALAGAALRAPAGGEGASGARRAGADRRLRGPAGRADRAGRGAVALPQQARVLVRGGRGWRAAAGIPPRRPLERHRRRDGGRARLRARRRGARAGQGLVPRAGPAGVGPPRRVGVPAQPGGARGAPHRDAPGPAGDQRRRLPGERAGSRGRRGQLPVDAHRRRVRDHPRRRDRAAAPGRTRSRRSWRRWVPACASASPPRRSSRSTPRWPSTCTARRPSWPD